MKLALIYLISALILINLLPQVHAHCPLCTAAVGAAAVSANYYGLDSSIIGLLIGAFGVSTGLWIGLKIKKRYFRFQLPIILFMSFILTVVPLLYITKEAFYIPLLLFGPSGSIFNKVYWANKILLGSIIGALVTIGSLILHRCIKKVRGKVVFPFQGLSITLASLAISSFALYLYVR